MFRLNEISLSDLKIILQKIPPMQSILLLGPPGIGKSQSVLAYAKEEAERLGLKFAVYDETLTEDDLKSTYLYVDFRLTEVEPSDLLGLPQKLNGYMTYVPLKWAHMLTKAGAGLLFLDELTNVQRSDVIAAAYKIVLDRRVGFINLPATVRVIAAGNRPEHSSIAQELPAPLLNRFLTVNIMPPSVQDWVAYMTATYKDAWDTRVAGYLYAFKEDLYRPPQEAMTLEPYPTHRSWTMLSLALHNIQIADLKPKVAASYVGSEVAQRFSAFLKLNVNVDELLANPEKFNDLNTEQRWLSIVMLAMDVNTQSIQENEKLVRLLTKIIDVDAEMIFLCLMLLRAEIKNKITSVLINNSAVVSKLAKVYDLLTKYNAI